MVTEPIPKEFMREKILIEPLHLIPKKSEERGFFGNKMKFNLISGGPNFVNLCVQ
jgi:hypothetical protein